MSAFSNKSRGETGSTGGTAPQLVSGRDALSSVASPFAPDLDAPDFRAVALAAKRASAERQDLAAARLAREREEWKGRFDEAVRVLESQVRPILCEAVEAFGEVGVPAHIAHNFELGALPAWLCFYCEAPGRSEGNLNLLGPTSMKAFFAHDGEVLRGGTAKSYCSRPDHLEETTLSRSEILRVSRLVLDSYFKDLERKSGHGQL
jgi:hypothetical protein